jgi:phosphatidylethanolamine/phosphatidyl-N-methylethanolamine N-methyltransferase
LTNSAMPNQSLYHAFAPFYDLLFNKTYAGARKKAVDLLDLQTGERLLISGVGTGLDLPQIPAGVAVTGVDISEEMLLEAKRKKSPSSVNLLKMDAQRLDFPDASFDAALLNLIVSVAPDGRAVFQEAWRVLKPGARLVLFDKFLPEGQSVSLPRSILGRFFCWIGTDINRKLSDIAGDVENKRIEVDESSLFWGQYRILRFKKVFSD